MTTTANVTDPIKPVHKTSIFKQAALSLPLAITEALVGTWLAYHMNLPADVARELCYAIWGACFVGGAGSSLQASGGLVSRSNLLTQTKAKLAEAAAVSLNSDAPDAVELPDDGAHLNGVQDDGVDDS
ncbi:hypothetical protein IAD21_00909 [Abditibacteriota bacterium]|nr:hypothetical protein IAD21_00909 [Abditibacteriota bacterium]